MTTIAEAYVQIKPSFRGFEGSLNNELGPSMSRAGASGGKAFGGGFVPALGGMAVAGAAALAGLGIAGAAVGISTAASMEQARISFTTMLGSAEKADGFLKQLADFAARTPFEFPELQTAASSLISAGINADKVIPIMTTLGNVTSGMGTGSEGIKRATVALQQMQAAGKITGEDLNQLRDAGIPVYDLLASATGKSKEEVVALANAGKLGKKELDAMMAALASGKGLERFNGLMEAQSSSLNGMISTLKDNLGMGLAKAMEPLMPLLKDGIGKAAEWLGNTAMPALAKGIQWVIDTAGPVVESLRMFWGAFTGEGYDPNLPADQINTLIDAGASARSTFDDVSRVITTQLLPTLKSIGDWIVTNIGPSVIELGSAFQRAYDVVAPIVAQLAQGIADKLGPLMPTITGIFQGIGRIVADVMSIIAVVVRNVFNGIAAFWAEWGGPITSVVSSIFSGIVNNVAAVIDVLQGIIHAVMLAIHGDWSGAWEAIKASTVAAWGHIKAGFSDGVDAVWAIMKHLGTVVGEAFGELWAQAKAVGANMVQGIADGIRGGIEWVKRAISDVIGDAVTFAKQILHIASPSRVMRDQVGLQISAGMALGIGDGGALVTSAMDSLTKVATRPVAATATFGASALAGGESSAAGFGQKLVLMVGGVEMNAYLTTREDAMASADSLLIRAGRG